jgi:hypothetical protein
MHWEAEEQRGGVRKVDRLKTEGSRPLGTAEDTIPDSAIG